MSINWPIKRVLNPVHWKQRAEGRMDAEMQLAVGAGSLAVHWSVSVLIYGSTLLSQELHAVDILTYYLSITERAVIAVML
jgi:hypothetical protein